MGKIRIKTFEESTPEELAKLKAKKEAKKAEKARVSGMGGGQRVKTVGPSMEELEATATPTQPEEDITIEDKETLVNAPESASGGKSENDAAIPENKGTTIQVASQKTEKSTKKEGKTKKEKFIKVKTVGKRHKANLSFVSKSQTYSADQALAALKKFKKSNFDETVELHINVKEKGTSGQVVLPHGTGKTLVIKIADDAIIEEVSRGKINFDILVATPQMMPQLAKVAKILGPRGLMPNPKNGTVTDKPEEAVKKLSAGQISYKTESVSPILHVSVGKISFDDKKLKENISAMLGSVGAEKINSVTLKSTMSPGIRLNITNFS